MNLLRCLPVAFLVLAGAAHAQSAGECPLLPAESGMSWKTLVGPDFVFCKAIRDNDQSEAFAVTIAGESPFKPKRVDRAEETTIDGHAGYWYRSEIASAPNAQVRETLVELDDGRVAHISLHADSEAELASVLKEAEALQFRGPQLSIN